ncbi:radical SAM protein [Thermodesulfobacteriota bacterium]
MKNDAGPAYLELYVSGELQERARKLHDKLAECCLCPRACRVNRLEGDKGVCRTGSKAVISSYNPHFGEESPLVGTGGSGTLFFTNCNLLCVFCQNFEISHQGEGFEVSEEQIAAVMINLQEVGCHNINFVTPSHVVPQIVGALSLAVEKGLSIPLVYNSSGYDSVETLALLDGIIDIYMPDFKFWSEDTAKRYCKAPDYPERAQEALFEMHRQVVDLELDSRGIARRGLLVRHLVMPGCVDETREIMGFLARDISLYTYVNVMDQYRPCGRALKYPPIDRPLDQEEYNEAVRHAKEAGLTRLDERNLLGMLRRLNLF